MVSGITVNNLDQPSPTEVKVTFSCDPEPIDLDLRTGITISGTSGGGWSGQPASVTNDSGITVIYDCQAIPGATPFEPDEVITVTLDNSDGNWVCADGETLFRSSQTITANNLYDTPVALSAVAIDADKIQVTCNVPMTGSATSTAISWGGGLTGENPVGNDPSGTTTIEYNTFASAPFYNTDNGTWNYDADDLNADLASIYNGWPLTKLADTTLAVNFSTRPAPPVSTNTWDTEAGPCWETEAGPCWETEDVVASFNWDKFEQEIESRGYLASVTDGTVSFFKMGWPDSLTILKVILLSNFTIPATIPDHVQVKIDIDDSLLAAS
jgi:hypothetical protein